MTTITDPHKLDDDTKSIFEFKSKEEIKREEEERRIKKIEKDLEDFKKEQKRSMDVYLKDRQEIRELKKDLAQLDKDIIKLQEEKRELESKEFITTTIRKNEDEIWKIDDKISDNQKKIEENWAVYRDEGMFPARGNRDELYSIKNSLKHRAETLREENRILRIALDKVLEEVTCDNNSLLGKLAKTKETLEIKTQKKELMQAKIKIKEEKIQNESCPHKIVATFGNFGTHYLCCECGKKGRLISLDEMEKFRENNKYRISLNLLPNVESMLPIINIITEKCSELREAGCTEEQIVAELEKEINLKPDPLSNCGALVKKYKVKKL